MLGNGKGLNLENIAVSGQVRSTESCVRTRLCLIVISGFWIALLVAAAGLKTHASFLLAVGSLGTLQNVALATSLEPSWRTPQFCEVYWEMTVMDSLFRIRGYGEIFATDFFSRQPTTG
jgi:hypothetical protein